MRLTTIFIFILSLVPDFSYAKDKMNYRLIFKPETSQAEIVINGSKKIQITTEEIEIGLAILTTKEIAKALGNELIANKHPFSFNDPIETQIEISNPKSHLVFSSFQKKNEKYEPNKVSQFVVGIVDRKFWEIHEFTFEGTTFQLVAPKKSPQVDSGNWENSIRKVWSKYLEKFGSATNHLVFVDLKGPISGGPLGENVLAFFADENLPTSIKVDMEANLGWKPQISTRAYVQENYPKSKDQWSEYLLGTFSHEIGHLYFGFGLTREKVVNADELWFSLGMGMLYDMMITKDIVGNEPQLELDVIKQWKNKISFLKDVDQRLIKPNRDSDKKYKFDRKKVFGHGKAAFFLGELRKEIGTNRFDTIIVKYINSCRDCDQGYEDFKKFLNGNEKKIANHLEKKYLIN